MASAARSTNLIVDATPDRDVKRRLEIALGLTAQLAGSLTAICAAWPSSISMADAIAHSPLSSLAKERELRNEIARVSSAFDQLAEGSAIDTHWCDAISHPSAVILDHALLADLVIMSMSSASSHAHADPLEIAARSGSPVLRLGSGLETASFEKILIGWKDSREAGCAIRAALPFLQRAGEVVLAGVGENVSGARLAEVGEHLSNRGVVAQILHIESSETAASTILADLTRREYFHLVVAGARSHGLWKERLFGGVTRDFLTFTDVNWLLAN